MSLLLKLLIVYIFFAFFIIGFFLSKVKFNIRHFKYKTNLKETDKDFEINVGIYLYGYIKILGATLENDGVRIFGKKVSYNKFKWFEPFKNVDFKGLNRDFKLAKMREWKLELKKLDLKLDMGFKNVLITSFTIFLISTLLSFLVKKTVKKYNPKKYKYIINPHYRSLNIINLELNSIITAKTIDIIYILLKYKKKERRKASRQIYKKSYDNI